MHEVDQEVDQDVVVIFTIFLFNFFSKIFNFFVYYVHEGVCRVFTFEGVCRVFTFTFEGVWRVFTLVYINRCISRIVVQKRSFNWKIHVTLIRRNTIIFETRAVLKNQDQIRNQRARLRGNTLIFGWKAGGGEGFSRSTDYTINILDIIMLTM